MNLNILQALDLQADESSFTGEMEPRHKHTKTLNENADLDCDNIVYMGTLIRSGHGKVN